MPNKLLLLAAGSHRLRRIVAGSPLTRGVVQRFVAGEVNDEAIAVARRIVESGMRVTIDHLGEGTTTVEQAAAVRDAYLSLLSEMRMPGTSEVSVKLSALGSALPHDGRRRRVSADARHLCRCGCRRRHGDPRHGGSHHG